MTLKFTDLRSKSTTVWYSSVERVLLLVLLLESGLITFLLVMIVLLTLVISVIIFITTTWVAWSSYHTTWPSWDFNLFDVLITSKFISFRAISSPWVLYWMLLVLLLDGLLQLDLALFLQIQTFIVVCHDGSKILSWSRL